MHDAMQKIHLDIVDHDFSGSHVLPDEHMPGYSYTTGFTHTYKHPEIVLSGIPPNIAEGLFRGIAELVKGGETLVDEQDHNGIVKGLPVKFRSVPIEFAAELFLGTGRFYTEVEVKRFSMLQMIWPGKDGVFQTTSTDHQHLYQSLDTFDFMTGALR